MCLGVVAILLLNVMGVFSVGGGALLDRLCMVFQRMCASCACDPSIHICHVVAVIVDNDGSIIAPSILGLRFSGSCDLWMRLELMCGQGEECDCGFQCRYQNRVFLQVDAYISQVTVDHGFQLWDFWSRSTDCDVSYHTLLTWAVGHGISAV